MKPAVWFASRHQMALSLAVAVLLMTASTINGSSQTSSPFIIAGGMRANIGDYPWLVSLEDEGHHQCGGSVLSDRWVVTAAHCFDRNYKYVVRSSTSMRERGGLTHQVKSVILHELYNKTVFLDYDIALLEMEQPFVWTSHLQPIPGLATENPAAGTRVLAAGWGRLETNGSLPEQLQELRMRVQDWDGCRRTYAEVGIDHVTESKICAMEGGKGVCNGDSGGPIIELGSKVLVGIVSCGKGGCANPTFPTLHTSVAKLRDWIREKTGV